MKPLVTICCITYNHLNYITECIEGFLLQKTTFPIEILIFDDASTDGTKEIIEKYASQEKRVKTFLQTENQWLKKKYGLLDWLFPVAKGKYIALCEGDDYWTDPYKLQKQVDFLECNNDYVCCLTESLVGDTSIQKNHSGILEDTDILSEQILIDCSFATNTIIFRNNLINFSDKIFLEAPLGDTLILYLLSLKGKIKYFSFTTGFYRKHMGGLYTSASGIVKIERQIIFLKLLLKNNYIKHESLINKLMNAMYLDMAYNYAFSGNKLKSISCFKNVNICYYFLYPKKVVKTIFHLIVK